MAPQMMGQLFLVDHLKTMRTELVDEGELPRDEDHVSLLAMLDVQAKVGADCVSMGRCVPFVTPGPYCSRGRQREAR